MATAYQGHVDHSSSKAANTEPTDVAPADRYGYDPADFSDEPGAGARGAGYPRSDGQSK